MFPTFRLCASYFTPYNENVKNTMFIISSPHELVYFFYTETYILAENECLHMVNKVFTFLFQIPTCLA